MYFSIPPATWALLITNGVVFLLEQVIGDPLFIWFGLWPLGGAPAAGTAGFLPWQLVTYSFLHGSLLHLFFNMFALYMFGSEIERVVGQRRYLAYYFTCVVTAAAAQLMVSAVSGGPAYPTVGASGGVFGLLLAFGMYFPRRTVMLLFPPIPMPAWLFVIVYGALELYLGVTGTQAGVAHFAHLGGMLGGYLMIRHWRRPPPRRW
ncbi:MAG TPA: rhomboid family intramembrane serine protease [Burkholderiales bacterium]|nr:rhomboid family intramembrane serine protease [Burkholderiales bacterium]